MRVALAIAVVAALVGRADALDDDAVAAGAATATNGLRTVTRRLASTELAGRDNATPGSAAAQRFLIRRLRRLGTSLRGGRDDEAYRQRFGTGGAAGANLLAVIPGRERRADYVVVGAHYDHLGTRSLRDGRCLATAPPGGAVCPGATDDAAGVAAVLAIGRAVRRLPTPPRRSIVLALWDAEEDGLVGSRHYVARPVVPLARIAAYVNFDIVGADLLPSLATTSFAVGGETGGAALRDLVGAAVVAERLEVQALSYVLGEQRSDDTSFVEARVPTVLLTDATTSCYHRTGDVVGQVDFRKLAAQSRMAFRIVVGLAETRGVPTFVAPGPGRARYADAVTVHEVLERASVDDDLFHVADRTVLQTARVDLAAMVQDGPGLFGADDVTRVLEATAGMLGAIERLGCPPRGRGSPLRIFARRR